MVLPNSFYEHFRLTLQIFDRYTWTGKLTSIWSACMYSKIWKRSMMCLRKTWCNRMFVEQWKQRCCVDVYVFQHTSTGVDWIVAKLLLSDWLIRQATSICDWPINWSVLRATVYLHYNNDWKPYETHRYVSVWDSTLSLKK